MHSIYLSVCIVALLCESSNGTHAHTSSRAAKHHGPWPPERDTLAARRILIDQTSYTSKNSGRHCLEDPTSNTVKVREDKRRNDLLEARIRPSRPRLHPRLTHIFFFKRIGKRERFSPRFTRRTRRSLTDQQVCSDHPGEYYPQSSVRLTLIKAIRH